MKVISGKTHVISSQALKNSLFSVRNVQHLMFEQNSEGENEVESSGKAEVRKAEFRQ